MLNLIQAQLLQILTKYYYENPPDNTLFKEHIYNIVNQLENCGGITPLDIENIVKFLITYKRIEEFENGVRVKVVECCPILIPLLKKLGYNTRFFLSSSSRIVQIFHILKSGIEKSIQCLIFSTLKTLKEISLYTP